MKLGRRTFIKGSITGAAMLAAPAVLGQGLPRVVVVGGGPAGATVARILAIDGGGAVEISLIEPARLYQSCIFSNLALTGLEAPELPLGYNTLARAHGITVIHDWALAVDRDAGTVALAAGGKIPYDRLVLTPGIEFIDGSVPGWNLTWQGAMPHAWRGGAQIALLRRQLETMEEGGTFCLIAPPETARCPLAAYERVTLVQQMLAKLNPRAKILLLDPNETFPMRPLFKQAWSTAKTIERLGPDEAASIAVRPEEMTVLIDDEVVPVDVCNVIPAQGAGRLAVEAGLTDASGWVPVNPFNMQAAADPSVYVLGDAAAQGDMPRTAFSAQRQAQVAADVLLSELTGSFTGTPDYADILWPVVAPGKALRRSLAFEAEGTEIKEIDRKESTLWEPRDLRDAHYDESQLWYAGLIEGMLG